MRTTNNKKLTAYKKRIANTVKTIFDLTSYEPLTDGFAKYSKNILFKNCGSILQEIGLVNNEGNKTKPSYHWVGSEPGRAIYNKVYNVLQERKENKLKKVAKNTAEEEVYPIVTAQTAKPAILSLVNFTDQQLWDELKKRNYDIVGNRLCQITYLQ